MNPMLPLCDGVPVSGSFRPDDPSEVPAVQQPDGRIVTEWALTDDERRRVRCGERIRLELWDASMARPVRFRLSITSEQDPS